MRISNVGLVALICSLAVACGGGGGSDSDKNSGGNGTANVVDTSRPSSPGGTVTSTPDKSWLFFHVSDSDLVVYQGEKAQVSITAHASKKISQNFNVAIIDRVGVFDTNVLLKNVTPTDYEATYIATLPVLPTLPPGVYSVPLEVRLCEDSPLTCAKPISGSPWQVPLKVTVKPVDLLSPLTKVAGLPVWSGLRGNAMNSGYIPVGFDPTKFSRRWEWQGLGDMVANSLAIADGQVFVVGRARPGPWTLYAIDESTGKENWRTTLGITGQASAPVVAKGQVIVTSADYKDSKILHFSQQTGALLREQSVLTPCYCSDVPYGAPTISGDHMFATEGGRSPSLSKYDLNTGTVQWSTTWVGSDGQWSPATDGTYVYAAPSSRALVAYDLKDGSRAFDINESALKDRYGTSAPVLSGTGMAYALHGSTRLNAFDLKTRQQAWSMDRVDSMPAVTPTTLYATAAGVLKAVDPKTGIKQWEMQPVGGNSSLIATDNTVFLGSFTPGFGTYAIDVRTRHKEMVSPRGGTLAISDQGVLYVLWQKLDTFGIAAVNLR